MSVASELFLCTILCLVSMTTAQMLMTNKPILSCREDTTHLNWTLPINATINFATINFQAFVSPDVPNPKRIPIASYDAREGGEWKIANSPNRYRGRLFNTSRLTSHMLINVVKKDAGTYDFDVVESNQNRYQGHHQLIVYHEDNLIPELVGNTSDSSDEGTLYAYSFKRPFMSPAEHIEIYAQTGDKKSKPKRCTFYNESECEIMFSSNDFGDLYGALEMVVNVINKNGTPHCNINPHYSLFITLEKSTNIGTGSIAGIVVGSVVIATIVTCLVSVYFRKYKDKKVNRIPLLKGLEFVKKCIEIIQCIKHDAQASMEEQRLDTEEALRGIYRANKPESQIRNFIQQYQKTKGKCLAEYGDERSLLAAAIKLFLREEDSSWFPLDLQRTITNEEKASSYVNDDRTLKADVIRRKLRQSDSKEDRARYDILAQLTLHFLWLAQTKETLDENSQVVNYEGIATVIVPHLFREVQEENTKRLEANESLEPIQRIQQSQRDQEKQMAFYVLLIKQAQEIFTDEDGPDPDNPNTTRLSLLRNNEDKNMV